MSTLRNATIADVVRTALEAHSADLRVSMPGEIVSFDASTQLAHVRPLLREVHEDEDGSAIVEDLPVIPNVPVQMFGAGGFSLTVPVAAGDPCLLVFSDRSLDLYIERGGSVDPIDTRRHDLTDAVALLGVRAKPGALASFDTDAASLRHTNGTGVFVTSGRVDLGKKNAAYAVALAEKVSAQLDALKQVFQSWTPVTMDGGAALKVSLQELISSGWPAPVASSKVKADE